MRRLSPFYQLLFLSAAVLVVFYPSLSAEINVVDDLQAVTSLSNRDHFSLTDIFFPRTSGGGYYRPLIGLSYWVDKHVWALKLGVMHLEVVVAHLLNAVLAFFITRKLIAVSNLSSNGYIPLAIGLLFAFHPIVTESVNWISGRTDIMMGNFVLASFYLILSFKQKGVWYLLFFSLVLAVLALGAKEAAFGYLIAIPLFLLFKYNSVTAKPPVENRSQIYLFLLCYVAAFMIALYTGNYWLVLIIACVYLAVSIKLDRVRDGMSSCSLRLYGVTFAALVLALAAFYGVRKIAFASDVDKIGQTMRLMFADMNYTISLFLGALGFYLKKLIQPLPLNFFIVEIDPLYDFIGIAVLLFTLRMLVVRSLSALLFLTGLCLTLPALPFAFGTIAWTGYAERYIYLPSVFWMLAFCLWIVPMLGNCSAAGKKTAEYATVIVIALAVGVTYSRNITWQTNVTLLKDTVIQSPKARMLRDMYIAALVNAGNVAEAKRQYEIAKTVPVSFYNNRYDDRIVLIIGAQYSKEGKHAEALQIYQEALVTIKYGSAELVKAALHEVETMLGHPEHTPRKQSLEKLKQDLAGRMAMYSTRAQ